MTMQNLVQHRSEPNVWEPSEVFANWDAERWLAAIAAGTCLVVAFRRRSVPDLLLVLGGCALAWWAIIGVDERRVRRGRLRAVLPGGDKDHDLIAEASQESFPASDAPAWTSTTGSVRGSPRLTH